MLQENALAGPGRADDAKGLAGVNLEIDVLQHVMLAEELVQMVDPDPYSAGVVQVHRAGPVVRVEKGSGQTMF